MADSLPHHQHHHHHHHQQQNPEPIFFSTPNLNPQTLIPKRKRGRPRKYGSASLISSSALSPLTHSSTSTSIPRRNKLFPHKDSGNALYRKKPKVPGSSGHGFTPHVIMVAAGEDVAVNVLSFVQQCKRSVCIMSAFGSVCNVSLCHSEMLGGKVTYEGRYEIILLSGSFLYMDSGGASTSNGGINVCLSGTDGRVVGGGIDGSLVAASPVQVMLGTFVMDSEKNLNASSSKESMQFSPNSLRSLQESTMRTTLIEGNSDRLCFGGAGNNYMVQSRASSMMPSALSSDWRGGQVLMHEKSRFLPDDDHDGTCRD